MAKFPGLALRGTTYQVRKRVPEDVRNLIAAKPARWKNAVVNPGSPLSEWKSLVQGRGRTRTVRNEIVRSLKTKDLRQAKARYHDAMSEFERLFDLVRDVLGENHRAPSDYELRQLVFRQFARDDAKSDANLSSTQLDEFARDQIRETIQEDLRALAGR